MRVGAAGGDVVASLGLIAPEDTGLVEARGARRHVRLYPDDRLDAGRLGGRVELVDAEHVAVVGDRQGGLAQAFGLGHVVLDLSGTVQHGVVGVDVKVDEVVLGGCLFLTGRLRHGSILGPRGAPPPGGGRPWCRQECAVPAGHSRNGRAGACEESAPDGRRRQVRPGGRQIRARAAASRGARTARARSSTGVGTPVLSPARHTEPSWASSSLGRPAAMSRCIEVVAPAG